VGAPRVVDTHLPNAFVMEKFAPEKVSKKTTPAPEKTPEKTNVRALALHALRPPPTAEVQLDRGRPRYVTSTGIAGQVVTAAGPYRVRDGWWRDPIARDYYDVELSDGAVYRLYQQESGWFVEGWYE
jgi:protein ImuB